eukprot:3448191-Rhodomonas_salina.4
MERAGKLWGVWGGGGNFLVEGSEPGGARRRVGGSGWRLVDVGSGGQLCRGRSEAFGGSRASLRGVGARLRRDSTWRLGLL